MPSAEQEAYKARTGSYASSLQELRGTGPYSSSSSSSRVETQKTAQGQTVTITRAGAGKTALTPAQIESENQRMREEIEKYGYYTPLEYNASSDEYYQTAPDISPSKYLQTPSKKTPEYMFEPSATWQTPTAAKKQMEARIASGEYTTQQVGYKTEVGVKGEGGVAYYGDDVLLGSLIRKKELKGVGVSPKQKELQTGSIIADMVFEGYVKPPKSTEKGFELEFTEAGQQVKPYLLSKLNQVTPENWLMEGTRDKLIFSGKPIVTVIESTPTQFQATASPLASKNPLGDNFVGSALVYASGVKMPEKKAEENGFYSIISGIDRFIEGSPLGATISPTDTGKIFREKHNHAQRRWRGL